MTKIYVLLMVISGLIFLRSFMVFNVHVVMHSRRHSMCIKRILKQQKGCDFLNACYQSFVMLGTLLLFVNGLLHFFNSNVIEIFNIISLIIIGFTFATLYIVTVKTELNLDLFSFYHDILDYRSKEKVHTVDNDYEVYFIRSYEKVLKHKRYANIWFVIFIISFIIFY